MSLKDHITVIVKPTHNCNLRCKYCYIEENAEKGNMPLSLAEEAIKKVSEFSKTSNWIWHGGEPLLMGVDFFKEIQKIQKFYEKKGNEFYNGIQTNGTLINNEILDFIEKANDFDVGLSIDGPEKIHNRTRIYSNGKGSFKKVLKATKSIKERKNQKIGGGAICVISATNIEYPKELYEFFKSEEISVKFNPLIKSGRAIGNINELAISPREYGTFLVKLWNIYDNDCKNLGKVTIDIDPFMEVIGNLYTKIPSGCNYSFSCRNSFISIGPQGDIYPCGRFDGIKEFWMGNIKTHSIEESVESNIAQKLSERNLENIANCKNCNLGYVCNSGCMHNAYCAEDIMEKDPYCISYKMLFSEMKNILDREPSLKGGKTNGKKTK